MRERKQPSIKDIAREAGVSIGTVDRVVHRRGRVSASTADRVREIIRRLGYSPNIFASRLSLSKTVSLAVVMPRTSQDSGYWALSLKGIQRAARELEPYNVQVRLYSFDRYSERSLCSEAEKALKEKPAGLLVAPVLVEAAERVMRSMQPRIPCVFFDTDIPGVGRIAYVAQDGYRSGVLAASLMEKMIEGKGTIAVAEILPADYHISERLRGFRERLAHDGRFALSVYGVRSSAGEQEWRAAAGEMLRDHRDLRGVFVSNAWTHPFARCIRERERRTDILIAGYDLVAKNRILLEKGAIDFLISQRPGQQAYEGLTCLYRHTVLHTPVRKRIPVPMEVLVRENVRDYEG